MLPFNCCPRPLPPLALPVGKVRLAWHERTHAAPAQVWLRQVITDTAAALMPGPRIK